MEFTVRLGESRDEIPAPSYAQDKAYEAFTVPLHRGVADLGFLYRTESWKWRPKKQGNQEGYELKSLSYTIENDVENLFLAFYRLVPREPDSGAYSEHKAQYLKALAKHWNKNGGWRDIVEHFATRQQRLLAALEDDGWKPWSKELVTDARLIAGLGYKGALEVGLTLHPLYGFPYLPGTAVKGIARAYAEHVINAPTDLIRKIFGSPKKDPGKAKEYRVGCIRFFDALPTSFPELSLDVMTPHFGDYYMDQTSTVAPGDWHGPIPVSFLTVADGQPFCFSLAAHGDAEITNPDECLQQAAEWLEAGLKKLGAGGKTAAGYGYFSTQDEREAEKEKLGQKAEALKAEEKARQDEEERKRAEQAVTWIETITKTTDGIYARVVGHKGRTNIVTLYVRDQEGRRFEVGGGTFVEGTILMVQVTWSKKSKKIAQVGAPRTVRAPNPS